jgi:RNA polymerase sigma-70 factor (ECF subfamily)
MHLIVLLAWLRGATRARQLEPLALIHAALEGDRWAAIELSRRVGPAIRARVLRITRGRPTGAVDLEDMVQEVWGRLLANDGRRLRAFDPGRGVSLPGFISLIAGQAVAEIIEAQHAQKRRAPGGTTTIEDARGVAASSPSADRLVGDRTELAALWAHLEAHLPPRGVLVMHLLFVDRLSPADIVARTHMKRATVDSWKFKIKKAALAWRKMHGSDPVPQSEGDA